MDGGVSSEPMARASCGLRAVRDMNGVGTPADANILSGLPPGYLGMITLAPS